LACVAVSACGITAQSKTTASLEPASLKSGDLVKQADLVASIRIVSGDTEHDPKAVYKGEILEAFNAAEKGAIIYFGPFTG